MSQLPGGYHGLKWFMGIIILLLLMYGDTSLAGATLASNPVLSYDWSGDSGNIIVDGSGYGNNGTDTNTTIFTMDNGFKYRVFDTGGKYIIAPTSASLNATMITIESIFDSNSTGEHQTICQKRDYPNNGYWYGIDVSGCFYFYVMRAGVAREYLTNINVTDGNVHYITATYDGRYMYFYDFGELKDSRDWNSSMLIGDSPGNFYVGTPTGQHPFNGSLYLLRVTDRALNSSEVVMNVDNDMIRLTPDNSTSTLTSTPIPTPTPDPDPTPTPGPMSK